MKELYLLCDKAKVLHVTDDPVKAKHWQELLAEQGKDPYIITISKEEIDSINALSEKSK